MNKNRLLLSSAVLVGWLLVLTNFLLGWPSPASIIGSILVILFVLLLVIE